MFFDSYKFMIARRYLAPTRRNRFISFVTAIAVLGVMFGTSALLISLAILDGFDSTLRTTMIAFMGHIEVTSFGRRPLPDYQRMVATLPQRVPEIRAVSPFVSREAILRSRNGMEGVAVKGIDPKGDVSQIRKKLISGSFDFPSDSAALPHLVIGERLANRLGVTVGDSLIVFGPNGVPTPDNPPAIDQFVLSGIYRSGMAEYDDLYTYTSLAGAQRLFSYGPDEVSGYDILVRDITKVEDVARSLETVMGYPHYPQTVFDIFQSIFAWLDLQRAPIPFVLGLISFVAAFNIISTLLMVVLEKTESIGVLSTLGARPGGILAIFVGQGFLIGGTGTALGVLLSFTFTILQQKYKLISLDPSIYFVDAVPVALVWNHYLIVVLVSLTLCLVATIIPAFVAAKLKPVDALRFK
jgi:lipoprotein-releasing system permease protein